ncbi:MAG: DUF1822 family protein [Stigonema ocellatum SAG 48.90 = DSM 106950]|nr:DUF1822 family protein [Stigonema ocellatum SAG 48.90 = DSM 106950]
MNSTKSNLPTILLDREAHRLAEKFAFLQVTPEKRQKVYFNTLAVYAVNRYLKRLDIETNLEQSDSCHPVIHSLFDVADLILPNINKKLECCSVLPGETAFNLPLQGTENLIGYVAVQFNDILTEAGILGFLPITAISNNPLQQISISDLESVDTLIDYIFDAQEATSVQKTPISIIENLANSVRSLRQINIIDQVRQTFQEFLEEPTLSYAHRSASNHQDTEISLATEIDLGSQKLVLIIEMTPKDEQRKRIRLSLESIDINKLPPFQLYIIEQSGEIFPHQVESESPTHIQLQTFNGRIGENFSVKIVYGNVSVTENFIVP